VPENDQFDSWQYLVFLYKTKQLVTIPSHDPKTYNLQSSLTEHLGTVVEKLR